MKDSQYLYGISGKIFRKMQYTQLLKYIIIKAKELIHELNKTPLESRDNKRVDDVLKAIEFNKNLIREIEK